VAFDQAELDQALFYLDNTLMVAPEDGTSSTCRRSRAWSPGDIRFGAIASFICDDNRYLAGQLLPGKPEVCKAGSTRRSGARPVSRSDLARQGAGDLARKRGGTDAAERDIAELPLRVDRDSAGTVCGVDHAGRSRPDQVPRSALRVAPAIYTNPDSAFVILRKIAIRGYTWYNWLYPFSG
jgi:hypothetical protein